MLKATVNVVASFVLPRQLSLFDAAVPTRSDAPAGRLVDVHDTVCADSVLVHQPAQLDEQPVRVGVLLLRTVELFHAHGGLLVAQVHAMKELLDPPLAWTDIVSLCVEPFVHQAPERHRAEARDVGHPQDVLGHVHAHRHSVFHWWDTSKNQSRTMESTWTLRRFSVLHLQRVSERLECW